MGSFGERLRREREMRGITLESISKTTKIRTNILEALEKEEFNKLPGGIFNKGFVRSYARFLGMNEEQVLKEFIGVAGDPEQPLPNPPVRRRPEIEQLKERGSWGGIATVVVCVIVLLFGGWEAARIVRRGTGAIWSGVHGARSQPAMTPAESVVTDNESSISSQGNEKGSAVPATDQPVNTAPNILQPASQTTTTLTPEQGVLERRKKIHAYSQVVLTTNNAGALAVSQNGKPLPPLGDQDQQTTVTFTPDVTKTSAVPNKTGGADSEGLPYASGGLERQEPGRQDVKRPRYPGSTDTATDTIKSRKEGKN
jgi:cytoskeleton protein RodZ